MVSTSTSNEGIDTMGFDIANIGQDAPGQGNVIVYWLGGAGFAFKFRDGEKICIDPYLSDAAERLFGFRRLSLPPLKASDLACDLLLFTHDHVDHLDVDSFDALVNAHRGPRVLAPASCADFLGSKGVAYEIVSPGTRSQLGNVHIRTVAADHGALCPDAVGFVLSFHGRCLYFTGDTAFDEQRMAEAIGIQPEIVIPCINGAYGNMNETEAANLAGRCGAKIAIPSHFWLFAEHGGCPATFRERVKTHAAGTDVLLLTPGRGVEV